MTNEIDKNDQETAGKKIETFKNLLSVKDYLNNIGYKLSKTAIYEHARARKLKPRDDGFYYVADVERYAHAFLKQKNDPVNSVFVDVQKRKTVAEARKIEAQAEIVELKAKIMNGDYIEKASLERELSYRAMLFKVDLENFARKESPEICNLVKGNSSFIPELIEYMDNAFKMFLARYAEDREFTVPGAAPSIDDEAENDIDNADFLEETP
jgi:hypothetical protein